MRNFFVDFINEECGASAVEYAVLIALITGVLVTAVTLLGKNIAAEFNTIAKEI
jgi:Flp pilus assembly pilin Flp